MKHLFFTCLFFISSSILFYAWSQDNTSVNEDITRIKRDGNNYLSAESTNANLEEARYNACIILSATVEEWLGGQTLLSENENMEKIINKVEPKYSYIKAKRGSFHRVLAYVSKQDITSLCERSKEDSPRSYSTKVLEAVAETPELPSIPPRDISVPLEIRLDEIEMGLINLKRMDNVISYLTKLADKGSIADHGKMASLPESGDYNLIVYDRKGTVLAYLRHKQLSTINLITGEPDTFANYSKSGGYWYSIETKEGKKEMEMASKNNRNSSAFSLSNEEKKIVDMVHKNRFDIDDYIQHRMELKQITWGDFGSSSNIPNGVPCHVFIRQAGYVIAIFRIEASGSQIEILNGEEDDYKQYPANLVMWVKD